MRKKIMYRAQMKNIMCKCTKSLSFLGTPDTYRSLARGPLWGTSDLSSPSCIKWHYGNESLCCSLYGCFGNVWSV